MNAPIVNPLERTQVQSTLRKMGNSTGVILPKAILNEFGIAAGEKVWLRVERGQVIIRPTGYKVREGWEEAAKRIGAEGPTEEEREWLEFDDPIDDDRPVPEEWLAPDESQA